MESNICNTGENPSTTLCTIDAQAYQYSTAYSACYAIGRKGEPTITFLDATNEGAGVKVVHSAITGGDGFKRQLAFDLTCDPSASTLSLTFTGETKERLVNSYNFRGATKYACKNQDPSPPTPPTPDRPLHSYFLPSFKATYSSGNKETLFYSDNFKKIIRTEEEDSNHQHTVKLISATQVTELKWSSSNFTSIDCTYSLVDNSKIFADYILTSEFEGYQAVDTSVSYNYFVMNFMGKRGNLFIDVFSLLPTKFVPSSGDVKYFEDVTDLSQRESSTLFSPPKGVICKHV